MTNETHFKVRDTFTDILPYSTAINRISSAKFILEARKTSSGYLLGC